MKSVALLVLALSAGSFAQDAIPAGTILPLQLDTSVRSNKARPGQTIRARLMQDVPLQGRSLLGRSKIRAGVRVIGHVVAVTVNQDKARISLRFDTLVDRKRRTPVITNLRALASMMEVDEAQIPQSGPDRGTSEDSWTTEQVGGEIVYRGAVVTHGSTVVGNSLLGGSVLVHVASRTGDTCRGDIGGNDRPQALWVFSSDACGIYGYPNVILVHAGRTDPVGEITLESTRGDLSIQSGSGLLLRVNAR